MALSTLAHALISIRRNPGVIDGIDNFGFTTVELGSNELIMRQHGVFRTNCLDW